MTTNHPPHEWLTAPRTEYFRDPEGRIESAFVFFRTGKAKRVVRPSQDHQIFVYLGFDGIPIAVHMLGPVPVRLEVTILYRLVAGSDGVAVGLDCNLLASAATGAPEAFIESTRAELRYASAELQRAS